MPTLCIKQSKLKRIFLTIVAYLYLAAVLYNNVNVWDHVCTNCHH